MTDKAYIENYRIIIPKSGNASMLLLEWISEQSYFGAADIIIGVLDNKEKNLFEITLNPSVYDISNCVEYINANL